MPDITLVKTNDIELTEVEKSALRKLMFGGWIDGLGEDDKKAWRRFWARVMNLGIGELFRVLMKVERNGKFHRKFFALLDVGYEAWEPQRKHKSHNGIPVSKNFDQFREDVTILAGFYEQTFDLHGQLKLKAKSISFASMEQDEFERVYSAVADVLLRNVLVTYKGRDELDEVVNRMIGFL